MIKTGKFSNTSLGTTPGSQGGFLIPIEFENQIVKDLYQMDVMRQLCHVITTSSEHRIPVSNTHSVATWKAEKAAYGESEPTFRQVILNAYKLTDLIKISEELMHDSMFDLPSYVSYEFARAFSKAEEQAFCVGTGADDLQPEGLFGANGPGVGVAGGASLDADDIFDLIYSLKIPYRKNACFLMNDATICAIRKLKDQQGRYLWQPRIAEGQPDMLAGYPVYTSEFVPTIGSAAGAVKVAAFGDFKSCYWIADRGVRDMKRLNELYAATGEIGFICSERVDGKTVLGEAVKVLTVGTAG